ncbi:probable maltase-glucoamylase 2 [Penaeus monodon]|uniref:probable maltase-glucoamylase 2 n=1 Tax=Penaeus monodon TaxID=6687 RepID=UPI0018A77759|nr:probable maltase-glucoamylase 2 [Penaeus monodon]
MRRSEIAMILSWLCLALFVSVGTTTTEPDTTTTEPDTTTTGPDTTTTEPDTSTTGSDTTTTGSDTTTTVPDTTTTEPDTTTTEVGTATSEVGTATTQPDVTTLVVGTTTPTPSIDDQIQALQVQIDQLTAQTQALLEKITSLKVLQMGLSRLFDLLSGGVRRKRSITDPDISVSGGVMMIIPVCTVPTSAWAGSPDNVLTRVLLRIIADIAAASNDEITCFKNVIVEFSTLLINGDISFDLSSLEGLESKISTANETITPLIDDLSSDLDSLNDQVRALSNLIEELRNDQYEDITPTGPDTTTTEPDTTTIGSDTITTEPDTTTTVPDTTTTEVGTATSEVGTATTQPDATTAEVGTTLPDVTTLVVGTTTPTPSIDEQLQALQVQIDQLTAQTQALLEKITCLKGLQLALSRLFGLLSGGVRRKRSITDPDISVSDGIMIVIPVCTIADSTWFASPDYVLTNFLLLIIRNIAAASNDEILCFKNVIVKISTLLINGDISFDPSSLEGLESKTSTANETITPLIDDLSSDLDSLNDQVRALSNLIEELRNDQYEDITPTGTDPTTTESDTTTIGSDTITTEPDTTTTVPDITPNGTDPTTTEELRKDQYEELPAAPRNKARLQIMVDQRVNFG